MAEDNKNFLTSLPGILTGIAAVIGAVTTLLVTLNGNKPGPPAGQQTDPLPDTTAATPQQPGAGTTRPPATQPGEPSQNSIKPVIPPLKIADDRLTIQPELLKTIIAFNLPAVIDDPDGFTFVRSMKSSSSQVVARINDNERFYTYHQNGNWWQVKTAQGKTGYVHVSRIRLLPNP